MNSSHIHGRKVDSPQLRVMKDPIDRPQTAGKCGQIPTQIRREDFLSLYNYQNQIRDLNHTNKEIQKKQFDFNLNRPKANVTIQYDSYEPIKQVPNKQEYSRHQKGSKSIGVNQKRRQQSQSVPRHQPSASIVHTQAQPLINIHIQNAKMVNQAKLQIQNNKRKAQQPENYISHKYASNGQQSAPLKSRSKSKNRQKSVQQKPSFIAQATKEILNQSILNKKQPQNQYMFSFDNKENESINYNDFSPSRIMAKPERRVNNFLDSDSSLSSPKQVADQFIAQKLEKSYFMDKSALLKHLSPDRNQQQSKTRFNKGHSIIPQQILSDRETKYVPNHKSNGSTIIHNHGLNESANYNTGNQSVMQVKIKRSGTMGSNGNNKLFLKGVDKLIKENLKRNKTKEQEEFSRRCMEEFKQKLKKVELTQRNQQVRKINASRITYNHQHKNSQIQNRINFQRIGYKKQRSKSCMNKTDNIFGGIGPRSKDRLPQNKIENHIQPNAEVKKEKKREKSFVLEIKELQKQIDGEIRREIQAGKLDIQPISTANKRSNLSTINAKKETLHTKIKKELLNMSAFEGAQTYGKKSKDELFGDTSNQNLKARRKSKSKEGNKSISQNIKKFIERKKNAQQQMKSLEQTIENKKNLKIKENLKSLHQFAKQHFRHQSYNFYPKKNNGLIQAVQQDYESGTAQPLRKLKPQFFKSKGKKKSSDKISKKIFDFRGNTIFDQDGNQNDISYTPNNERQEHDGDVSKEFYEDYQKLLSSIQKHQKQKIRDNSSSIERSAKKSSSKKRQDKNKIQSQLQYELEQSALLNKKARTNENTISIDQMRYQNNKNDFVQLPSVVQEKGASLIPPQSDIATLDRNHLDRSQYRIHESTDKNRYTDIRKSHDSGKASTKSPKPSDQKAKIKQLMYKYGHNLKKSQIHAPSADTKLLIKLHSAAITIQQNYRTYLQQKGFYDAGSSNSQSQMYVDSEEDQNQYNYDQYSEKKQIVKQLVAQTSPLRLKTKYQNLNQQRLPQQNQIQLKGNKFYSEDSSDIEKVIVCSIITSGRADGEESLSNTQKYIPLRQKIQIPTHKHTQQQQVIQPSSTSSAQSVFNTAIKTQVLPLHQRLQNDKAQESLDQSQQSSASQRKKIVPQLDFGKLNAKQQPEEIKEQLVPKIHKNLEEELKADQGSNTSRSVFERHAFQDFSLKLNNGEGFNVNNYPEMLKMREDAIKFRELEEQKLLQKMVKTKQMSPRTYDIRTKELDTWVSKEKEEVKKTRKVFEEQWQKTASIIEQTQKNQDLMKKLLHETHPQNHNHVVHNTKTYESLPSEQTQQNVLSLQSHRQSSRRDTTHLLDMIDDYSQQEDCAPIKLEEISVKVEQKNVKADQQKRDQERQRQQDEDKHKKDLERKKEMELLKEQERQKEEQRVLRIKEQEKQRQEEQEKLREADRKRVIELEKEKLKKDEEERKRKQQELEDKKLRDLEAKKKVEEDRKIREKAEALRQLKEQEIKKKKEEEEQNRLIEEQKRLEKIQQDLKQRELEEKNRQEQLKRAQDEKDRRQKEDQAQKERERIAKEKDLEKQRQEREDKEVREKQKILLKEKQEQEKLEMERKLAAVQKKFEQQNPPVIQQQLFAQLDKQDRYGSPNDLEDNLQSEPDLYQREFEDNSDDDIFNHQLENKLINDLIHEPKRGKEVLDSFEDEKVHSDDNLHEFIKPQNLRNLNNLARDDEPRGLSRTRSSQYLNDNKFDDEGSDFNQQKSKHEFIEHEFIEPRQTSQKHLNDESMDEDVLAEQLLKNQELQNLALEKIVQNQNFFSENFDDQKPEDLINKFQMEIEDCTQDNTNDLINQSAADKIFVQDGGELIKDEGVIEPTFKFDEKKNTRLSQEMRNQIPVEEEEHMYPGMPVSPVSIDGTDIRIMTGAQSLESTLSDGTEFKKAIQEVNGNDQLENTDIDQKVDKITDDIFRQLLAEMKVELDLLLLTDPRRLFREEANQNHFLSESGRFLIFERRGIKTDLFAIERYVEEVLDEILREKNRFLQNISSPISKNASEVLNQLQNSEIGSYEHFDINYPSVLPLDLYLKLEKRRKESREREQQENQNNQQQQQQPYGKDGVPLAWSRQNRRLKPIEEFTIEEMFEIVKHDLFRWAIMQAGTLPRREFVFNNLFDDELFAEIREKKLATLLAREMIETEPKWLNYEFEEAQVKIDIGDMILEQLVTETIAILRKNQGIVE